ncbi:serine/threonine-protein kinase [Singulisphaera sp. PoT]|uniref:serine/threonine-protein kinase n=1 Tax=Singulisphaera sp. PoT TaxID=3411797 RepID=UPI003BF5A57A
MANVSSTPVLSGMNYRVVSPLGTGAGSTILLISDKTAGGKRYALKVVKRQDADDDIYIAQAQTEFQASQKLNHPAIARIYDIRVKRSWFRISGVELLMEYVDGKTLDELEAPTMGQLVLVFNQVASALSHMHRRGVFHGDLKPSNIMLSKGGQVKLIDFGTAWIKGEEKNRIQGTPQYMAPEQVSEKVVDDRTDIYNFGATMYRMFTGRFAQQGIPKAGDGGSRKPTAPIQINAMIPGTLNETIMACLHVSPDRRPAGFFEIKNQLAAVAKYLGLEEVDLKGAGDDED